MDAPRVRTATYESIARGDNRICVFQTRSASSSLIVLKTRRARGNSRHHGGAGRGSARSARGGRRISLPAAGVDELVLDGVDVQLDVEDDELVELLVDVEDEVDDEVEVYGLVLLGVDELLVDVEDEELVELLVDVDVAGLDALGNNVPELIHADVVEDLDVPEEILCDVGVEL
eukprot:115028-Amphidinium_carterae.1